VILRVIEENDTHVKVNLFVKDACNGTLVFTPNEWSIFCLRVGALHFDIQPSCRRKGYEPDVRLDP